MTAQKAECNALQCDRVFSCDGGPELQPVSSFANMQAGARFADKTRQALAFEQLRSRRTHAIVYAGGYFDIFETLNFARFLLQLPAAAQDQLRHWLDAHLHTVQKRE